MAIRQEIEALQFKQIAVGDRYLYGLDSRGQVWFLAHNPVTVEDGYWKRVKMQTVDEYVAMMNRPLELPPDPVRT